MARIDWVHARLENWAMWHARMNGGGLGFATQSAFLSDPADRQLEARLPIDEVDASITDEAVTALQAGHSHLHEVVTAMYLAGAGVKNTARGLGCAESTVHARLGQADQVLATWFSDRKRRKEAEAQQLLQQIEAARPAKLQAPMPLPGKPKRKRGTLKLRGFTT